MGVTVKDIARHAGLSVTTVSRALNDHSDVAPATKARIRAVANGLNYHPNAAARTLKNKRANALGLVVPLGLHRSCDAFWLEFIGGMATACARYGADLLLSATDDTDHARASLQRMVRGSRVDGVVVCDIRAEDARIRWLQDLEIPFVAFGRTGSEADADYDYIDVDGAAGVLDGTLHLIHLGHRRIAYLGLDPAFGFSYFRLAGYREAMRRCGLADDPELVFEGLTEETVPSVAQRLFALPHTPTAVFASADFLALAVLRAARQQGRSVPADLSVVVFDDNLNVQECDPPLTAIGQPNRRLGEEGAELLLDRLNHPDKGPIQRLVAPSLVIRSSTGPRSAETEGKKGAVVVARRRTPGTVDAGREARCETNIR